MRYGGVKRTENIDMEENDELKLFLYFRFVKLPEMYFPEGFDDEDEYDGEDDLDFDYDEEDYYHHHGFDDLYDDVGEDYDYDVWHIEDQEFYVQDHEIALYEYSPETILVEDSTVLDVLKVSDMTIKLVEAVKLRLGLDSEEWNR